MRHSMLIAGCMLVGLANSALAGPRDNPEMIRVLTVCQALRDPARYVGTSIIVVGQWGGTGEGSWLSQTCSIDVIINDRVYPATLWTSASSIDRPHLPVGFRWDKLALRQALAEVRKTTRSKPHTDWYAVFGRLELAGDGYGLGHLNAAPAQLILPTKRGYRKLN